MFITLENACWVTRRRHKTIMQSYRLLRWCSGINNLTWDSNYFISFFSFCHTNKKINKQLNKIFPLRGLKLFNAFKPELSGTDSRIIPGTQSIYTCDPLNTLTPNTIAFQLLGRAIYFLEIQLTTSLYNRSRNSQNSTSSVQNNCFPDCHSLQILKDLDPLPDQKTGRCLKRLFRLVSNILKEW